MPDSQISSLKFRKNDKHKVGLDADLQTLYIFNFGFAFKSKYKINFVVRNDIMNQFVTKIHFLTD